MSARGILHLASAFVIAGGLLCISIAAPVRARRYQANSTGLTAIDPGAMEALDKMGVYLRTLKSFQVWADVTTDNVLDDGQTIQFSSKVNLLAARPNRMRVEVTAGF